MTTIEERILSYLDGSLSEADGAELMHQLSVSPEKRVILEQQIKLTEMTRMAQKPFDVPAELEASLAKRLPAIVASEQAARLPLGGLWGTAMRSLGEYPMRYALGGAAVVAALLLFLNSGSNTGMVSRETPQVSVATGSGNSNTTQPSNATQSANMTQQSNATQPTAPMPKNRANASSSQHSSAPATHTGLATQNNQSAPSQMPHAVADHSAASHHGAAVARNNANSTSSSANLTSRIAKNNRSHTATTRLHSHAEKQESNPQNSIGTTNSARRADPTLLVAENSTTSSATNSSTDNTSKNSAAVTSIGYSATDAFAETVPVAIIEPVSNGSKSIAMGSDNRGRVKLSQLESSHNTSSRSPWAVYASMGWGQTFLYVPSGANSYTSRYDGWPSAGVSYSFIPEFSVAAEVGAGSILNLSPTATAETSTDGITHIVTHSTTTSSSNMLGRIVGRVCFNPYSPIRYEAGLGFGTIFAKTLAPMASLQAGVSWSISDVFDLQTFGLYSGVWSKTSASTGPSASALGSNGPVAFKTADVAVSTVYTPAFSVRIGIQYRP